jgi:hypothetical protein
MATIIQGAPTHIQPLPKATPTRRSRMALAQKHNGRYNKKQNSPNPKKRKSGQNHLLQPHMDNQRKPQILSQNRFLLTFIALCCEQNGAFLLSSC